MKIIIRHKIEIGIFIFPLFMLICLRLLGFDGLYGQDSYEYLRYTVKMKEFFLSGIHPGDFIWTKGYPLISGVLALLIPANIAVQLVSAMSLGAVTLITSRIIKEIYKSKSYSSVFTASGLLLSPYMLRAAMTSMSDILTILCLTGSLYYLLRYRKTHSLLSIILCVFLGMYSIFTRYAAIIPVLILFIWLIIYWIKQFNLLHSLAVLIPILFLIVHFYFETKDFNPIQHYSIRDWKFTNLFKSSFEGIENGNSNYTFPNIIYVIYPVFHPGFFWINSLLMIITVVNKGIRLQKIQIPIIASLLAYALFLGGIPCQSNRFLLLTYPLVLVLIFPAFKVLTEKYYSCRKIIFVILMMIQLILFARAIAPSVKYSRTEIDIINQMRPYQNQTLYSFEIDVALQGRGLIFEYKNLWIEKYSDFKKDALILFNEEKFKTQWNKMNPMINWQYLKDNNSLKLIKQMDSGWELYRIEN